MLHIGLTEDMLGDLEKYEDLKKFLSLHKSIQKVKKNLEERKVEINGLKAGFKELDSNIKTFAKEQNKTTLYHVEEKGDTPAGV